MLQQKEMLLRLKLKLLEKGLTRRGKNYNDLSRFSGNRSL